MIRIAFRNLGGPEWTAGEQYMKNIFTAIRSVKDVPVEIILLVYKGTPEVDYRGVVGYVDGVIEIPLAAPPKNFIMLGLRRLQKIFQLESSLSRLLRKHRIEVVFASDDFGPKFFLPRMIWLPDFQNLYFPEFFDSTTAESFTKLVRAYASHADSLILSSESARNDLDRHFPEFSSKVRILNFVASLPEGLFERDPNWVCEYYHLPGKFIYLPNQFWKHKNHLVVIHALENLLPQHPEVTVVCTGNINEYRDRLYFSRILSEISSKGIRNNFIMLGLVPYEHVYSLMRQAVAVLQPSLFEGWSTTVEEVKSLGKRIIISDIPVHREQNPPSAIYFDPKDHDQLSKIFLDVISSGNPGPDKLMEQKAREELPVRTLQFGRQFWAIVQDLIAENPQ